ncbi:hypothetical protein VL10_24145 [Leclercia adecarboxylata]|nr:hypothetical protein VL10_24145 [Leclercia adecarboxylata]KMN66764.1 hypothetical protein VK95_04585 [Leclercia sp. LK8]
MSYNMLNHTSGSGVQNAASGQTMVNSAQVMQFLNNVGQQGGGCGAMAQDILQLMQQTPALSGPLTQQLTQLAGMSAPGENQIQRTLDDVCARYQEQIEALPSSAGGERQAAGQRLVQALSVLPGARTTAGTHLAAQLEKAEFSSGVLKQLDGLLRHVTPGDRKVQLAIKEALARLQRAAPEASAALGKLSRQLGHEVLEKKGGDLKKGKEAREAFAEKAQNQLPVSSDEQNAPVGDRSQRGRDEESESRKQPWGTDDEPDEDKLQGIGPRGLVTGSTMVAYDAIQPLHITEAAVPLQGEASVAVDTALRSQALNMVLPPAAATVSEQSAERCAQHILKDSQISLNGLVSAPLDAMLLQAATLGLKTFSNSASALSKSIKINGNAQEKLMDKKVADYQEQLAKSQAQAEKAKKGGILGKILNPIMTVINAVLKPVMSLLEKIPGVKSALSFISKNISELAFPFAVLTAVFCPMSLPVTLGLLAVTATTAGFSVADKVLGDKAPSWLKITDQIGDVISGLALMASTGVIAAGLLRASGVAAKVTGWLGKDFLELFNKLRTVSRGIDVATSAGNSAGQLALGIQQAKLQGETGEIAARISWNEAQAGWLKSAQEYIVDRVHSDISRSATIVESASKMLSETATLRARIAGSLV